MDLQIIWGSLKREVTSKHLTVELTRMQSLGTLNRSPVPGERRSRYLPGALAVREAESRPTGRLMLGFMERRRLMDARAAARRAWREAGKKAA